MKLKRSDLQQLAEERLEDARALLQAGCFSGAYYMSGYVVECALKAAIAKQTHRYDFPDKNKTQQSYTHDLSKLLELAGYTEKQIDQATSRNWSVVKDWKETSRYYFKKAPAAQALFQAVDDRKKGVFKWLKAHW